MRSPVEHGDFFRQRDGDEIGDTEQAEDGGKEGQGGRFSVKANGSRLAVISVCNPVRPNRHTMRIDSPTIKTRLWSAIVTGEVRKKKASVMWNSDSDRIMVGPEIIGILAVREMEQN